MVCLNFSNYQLRKTCNHPFTLEGVEENELSGCTSHADSVEKLIASSGKLVLLDKLLPRLKEQGHKVLIFSQMVKILDILEDYANARGFGCERIDGGVKGSERQAGIDRFSRKDSDKFLFLLCTKAGGTTQSSLLNIQVLQLLINIEFMIRRRNQLDGGRYSHHL
jgi:SNF2 family DNA or RNA helicase